MGLEKIVIALAAPTPLPDAALYTMDPDGSGRTHLFDFHAHPRHGLGGIWQPRIAPDGDSIYFSSDHAYAYTPARRNLFRLDADGQGLAQLTPGPNSGVWDQPGPYGQVEGRVLKANDEPWGNSPVYLEGVGLAYSQPDGSFRFEQVPAGERWIVAYRPGDANYSDAQPISVVPGATCGPIRLEPDYSARMDFEWPVPWGDRVYHRFLGNRIRWLDQATTTPHDVYTVPAEGCVSLPAVEGFDVAPTSGRLIVADYRGDGCLDNRGLYLTDPDGRNRRLLVDMMADWNWCGLGEVFWSPDETRLAVKGCYNWTTCLLVFDAAGQGLGWTCFPQNYTLYNVALHGWSTDGSWLLYSFWQNDPGRTILGKIRVNADGSLAPASATNLLTGVRLSGATWGNLNTQ